MRVVLNRIDERLIHGQILVSWIKKLSVAKIFVLDNAMAEDHFAKSVFSLSMPNGVSVEFYSVSDGVKKILCLIDGNEPNALILFKNPQAAFDAYRAGYHMKTLNIGCMNAGPSRKSITNNLFASDEELEMLHKLRGAGVEIYIQMVDAEERMIFSA